MIDKLRYTNIAQIYTKKLKFYNPADIDGCRNFCMKYGITFLPALDRKGCYELKNNIFEYRTLTDVRCCSPSDLIFDEQTLKKFEVANSDDVLFVTSENKIIGVVHIVDYNKDEIFFELYKILFHFEKMLRELLKKKETEESFLSYIKLKSEDLKNTSKSKKFWIQRYNDYVGETEDEKINKLNRRSTLGPFQSFYLLDLLFFASHKKYIKGIDTKKITDLRNKIAHANDIIKTEKSVHGDKLYNYNGLQEFILNALTFFKSYDHLEEALECAVSLSD